MSQEKKKRGLEEGEDKNEKSKGFFRALSPTKGQTLERLKKKKHGEFALNGEELFQSVREVLKGGPAEPDLGSRLGAWRKNSVQPQEELLRHFHLQVGESVRLHFPSLPLGVTEDQPHTYLKQVQAVVQRELLRLAPVLREAGLLGTVIDRYHTHTVSQLDQLLQLKLNSNQTFRLLQWTLHTYPSVLGRPELAADVQVDPLLLPEWLHCAKSKLLITTQESVAECLKRILQMEEEEGESCDHSDEEAFIRLPLDINQCLDGVVKKARALSSSLMKEIQRMCLSQLHTFLQSLQALERKRMSAGLGAGEGGVYHLFRIINTCRSLRLLAGQLASEAPTDAAAPAVRLLEELEAQAKKQLLHTATHITEAALKTYFKNGGDDMHDVTTRIEPLFAPLPLVKDTHTRKVLVDSVYQNVTSLYLRHLLLSNRSQLDMRWSDVGVRVRRDAEELHKTFTQQEGSVERCVSLQKVSDVLKTNDVNTLKLVLMEIINECPGISSEEQLNTLLRWKGQLSRQQQTEVMDAVVEYCPRSAPSASPEHAPSDSPVRALALAPPPPLRPASKWYRVMSCLRPQITA